MEFCQEMVDKYEIRVSQVNNYWEYMDCILYYETFLSPIILDVMERIRTVDEYMKRKRRN